MAEPGAPRAPVEPHWPRAKTGLDPMLVMGRGEFTDRQIEAYNERHVLPFNPEVGQRCQELPDPQFPGQYYRSCQTLRERAPHAYEALPDAELRDLAVHDATASMVLAERASAEQERVYWHLRAAALAEKTGPLMRLAERRYGAPYRLETVAGSMQTVPDTHAMVTRLRAPTTLNRPRSLFFHHQCLTAFGVAPRRLATSCSVTS